MQQEPGLRANPRGKRLEELGVSLAFERVDVARESEVGLRVRRKKKRENEFAAQLMTLRGEQSGQFPVLEAKRDAGTERGTAFAKHAARDLVEKWKRGTAVAVADSLFVDVSEGTHVAPAPKYVQPEVLGASAKRERRCVRVCRHAAVDHAVFDFAAIRTGKKTLLIKGELQREAK